MVSSTPGKPAAEETDKEKEKKKAAAAAIKRDVDDGWETVLSKKSAKSKQQ